MNEMPNSQPPIPAPSGRPCPNCGHTVAPNAKFCPNCAAPITPQESGLSSAGRIITCVILGGIAATLGAVGACFMILGGTDMKNGGAGFALVGLGMAVVALLCVGGIVALLRKK